MHTEAVVVIGPARLRGIMQAVVVPVATVQLPAGADVVPESTIPAPKGELEIEVSAHAPPLIASATSAPLGSLVVVVPPPQVPVRPYRPPAALHAALQTAMVVGTVSVQLLDRHATCASENHSSL